MDQDLIVFALTEDYADQEFAGNVSLVGGEAFDVGEALEVGGGRIALAPNPRRDEEGNFSKDEEERAWRDGQIVDALVKYEAVERVEPSSSDEPQSYDGVSVAPEEGPSKGQLEARARELDVAGRSTMDKGELAEAVAEREAALAEESAAEEARKAAEEQARAEAAEEQANQEGGVTDDDASTEGSDD